MRMIFVPIVLMMRWPPAIVPSPIAAAHAMTTQSGTLSPVGSAHDGKLPPWDPAYQPTSET